MVAHHLVGMGIQQPLMGLIGMSPIYNRLQFKENPPLEGVVYCYDCMVHPWGYETILVMLILVGSYIHILQQRILSLGFNY
jgi:hypothetical protein